MCKGILIFFVTLCTFPSYLLKTSLKKINKSDIFGLKQIDERNLFNISKKVKSTTENDLYYKNCMDVHKWVGSGNGS